MDDWDLIGEFVEKGSAGAFEALVGRYLGMVYGVAMREVGEHHLAEDVTQAVFALLAKKAPEMRAGTVVAGWLFRTARFTAQNAKKMERRRRFHEERAGRLREEEVMEAGQGEERMVLLDRALGRLGERDRGAVILRYYRRLEMVEVGKALGVSEGAARRRVERAVGKLRVKMGVKMGAGETGVGMLGGLGVVAVKMPAGVAAGALACAKGESGFEAIRVMMKGALKMMFIAKMKAVAVVVAVVMVVGGAGTLTVTRLAAQEEKVPAEVMAAHDTLVAMQKEVQVMDDFVQAKRTEVDEFRKLYEIPGVVDLASVEVHRLDRLNAKLEDGELEMAEAKRVLDAKKGAKDLPAGELERAQDAYDKAATAQATLRQMRDDCEKRLRDLDHFLVQYERHNADLKAMEELRTKLHVEYTLAMVKAAGLK